MAYRKADSLRWKAFRIFVGCEIKLSDNHTLINPKTGKAEFHFMTFVMSKANILRHLFL